MSDVYLPKCYTRKAMNLFKNLKAKNVQSAVHETSAPTMCDATRSRYNGCVHQN